MISPELNMVVTSESEINGTEDSLRSECDLKGMDFF